jgi:N-acetylglutamate synthase-like GNAT family acetyltransferase
MTTSIDIKPYSPLYQQQVIDLILGIQQGEFGIPISIEDQPDLLSINLFYQVNQGNFWCAVTPTGRVVGTISLIDIGGEFGTIRKMFVHADYRGRELAIATTLLRVLEAHATAVNMKTLYLGTLDILTAAQRFYVKNNYTPIAADDLPEAFPRMRLDNRFFSKKLASN